MRRCAHCGEEKPLSEFRQYYGGRKGLYTYCKECERIEARRKYLCRLGDRATEAQAEELASIELLYELRRKAGLMQPRNQQNTRDIVAAQLASYNKEAAQS